MTSQAEWPGALRGFLEQAEHKHVRVEQLQVYCMEKGWGEEYFWQAKDSPELLQLMNSSWKLSRVDPAHAMVQRFWDRLPTDWDSLREDAATELFLSANWLAGEKGHLYAVMHDKLRGILVVRYYFNF